MSIDVATEIARRLTELREHPELLSRYDLDRSGDLDEDEWDLVRRIVAAEVVHGVARSGGELDDPVAPAGVLHDRFEVVGLLGVGGQGRTWLANDLQEDEPIALKELAIGQALDWKAVDLFERESKVLEALAHPAIPRYVDAFHVETDGGDIRFFLAQEFVDGEPLDADIEAHHWTEDEAIDLLREALGILKYLHGLSPPVVHRDIKPSNLMRRTDGTLALIDFGAVSTVSPTLTGGSTVVGTNGYMPIEQYMGRAEERTDLYALGATVVHLLSHVHPADLPLERSRIHFEDHVNVSDGFAKILSDMLSPIVDDRPRARDVIAALDRLQAPPPSTALVARPDTPVAKRPKESPPARRDPGGALAGSRGSAVRRTLIILGVFVFGVQLLGFSCTRCHGHEEALLAINECPAATEYLGDNVRHSFVGFSCGGSEISGCGAGARGDANATIPVRGDDAAARYSYHTSLQNGVWTVTHAEARIDGAWQDVVPCTGDSHGTVLRCEGLSCTTNQSPLPDDVDDTIEWDPCDGEGFVYTADVDFESCCDFVAVGAVEHTGTALATGYSAGPTTVRVHTDSSVGSPGVRSLVAECGAELPPARHTECVDNECRSIGTPLPDYLDESVVWDPCDGRPFSFTGEVHFEPCCDSVTIDGRAYAGYDTHIRGASIGRTLVTVHTDASVNSDGIRSLVASCDIDGTGDILDCTGTRCTSRSLPDDANEFVIWDPCDGGAFTYRGRVNTEQCCDSVWVAGREYNGTDRIRGEADGPVRVGVEADSSVPSRGIQRLTANCR